MARILLAEDDPDIQALVEMKLIGRGHTIIAVDDGAIALDKARTGTFDLLVLDGNMPGLDGLSVARAIRADPALEVLPIILLSASARPDDIKQGLQSGANEYIVKPFSPRHLAERVESYFDAGDVLQVD